MVRIKSGPLRGWCWITGSAPQGCWMGIYERDSQRAFVENVRPGSVVYDIGANAGFFTLLASKLAGPSGIVYAFEPLPRNVGYLEQHLSLNRCENVRILPLAVAAESGTLRFAIAHNPSQGGLAESGDLQVEAQTLDAFVAGGSKKPDFMKIDVEGGESDVLAGALVLLREVHPTILLSTHGWQQHEQCSETLKALGYSLSLLRDGTDDGNYMLLATFATSRAR